jgi:arylsulfatase A-like enzyme
MVGVRDERWKLVRYREDGQSHELYDLKTDPHETKNRFDDTAARGERDRLDREIARLEPMIRVAAPIRS